MGFGSVFSGPLVRSSYRADEQRHAAADRSRRPSPCRHAPGRRRSVRRRLAAPFGQSEPSVTGQRADSLARVRSGRSRRPGEAALCQLRSEPAPSSRRDREGSDPMSGASDRGFLPSCVRLSTGAGARSGRRASWRRSRAPCRGRPRRRPSRGRRHGAGARRSRLLHDLRGEVVPDVRVQRSGRGERQLGVLQATLAVRLDAVDALFREDACGGGEQGDRVDHVATHERNEDVELEVALHRAGDDRSIVADRPERPPASPPRGSPGSPSRA